MIRLQMSLEWIGLESNHAGCKSQRSTNMRRKIHGDVSYSNSSRIGRRRVLEPRRIVDAHAVLDIELVAVLLERLGRCPGVAGARQTGGNHHDLLQIDIGTSHEFQGHRRSVTLPVDREWLARAHYIFVVGEDHASPGEGCELEEDE